MQSLPLFPDLFAVPGEVPAGSPAPRRGRRSKATAAAAAVVEAMLPGTGPSFDSGLADARPPLRTNGTSATGSGSVSGSVSVSGSGSVSDSDSVSGSGSDSVSGSVTVTESVTVSESVSGSVTVTESVSVSLSVESALDSGWTTPPPSVLPHAALHLVTSPPPPVHRTEAGVLVFDVETTGTDRKRDQVIELCMQRGLSGTDHKIWRFKPTVEIHPRAQEVHGISMEQLADCPSFASCADEIAAWFAAADVIVGYNLIFDIDMLQAECERIGRPPFDLAAKAVVDPFRLWQQCEPRSLQHAHQRFVGQGFEAAHSAAADVAATGRVLLGMLGAFGLDHHDWAGVATVCDPKRQSWVGPSRHIQWEGATVVMSFGKHAGVPLHQLAAGEHSGYLRWVCDRDFPAHVAEVCGRALELAGDVDGFLGWVRTRFGEPSATGAGTAPVSASPAASAAGAARA